MSGNSLFLRLLLWLYFPFVAGLWLASVGVEWFLVSSRLFIFPPVVLFMVLLALPIVQIPWACRCLFWRLDAGADEVKVPRKRLRALLDLVAEVAGARQLPVPDRVRFAADTVAHVYVDGKGERVLVLGGVALRCFSQPTLAGIVAHELGHFAAGDTELSRLCHRRRLLMWVLETQLVLMIRAHGPIPVGNLPFVVHPIFAVFMNLLNPVPWLLVIYHRLFALSYASHSRQQEYAADRFSVQQAGKEAAAESLILMNVIQHTPWARLSSIATSHLATNTHLDKIFTEQAARAGQIDRYDWERACRKALAARTGWLDSHPCLKDRLAALGVSSKKALKMEPDQSGSPPASALIDNWDEVESRLTGKLMSAFHEQYQWQQDMAQVAHHLARRNGSG